MEARREKPNLTESFAASSITCSDESKEASQLSENDLQN